MSPMYDYLQEAHRALPGTEKTFRKYIRYPVTMNQLALNVEVREYRFVTFQAKPFTTVELTQHLLGSADYIGGMPEELRSK